MYITVSQLSSPSCDDLALIYDIDGIYDIISIMFTVCKQTVNIMLMIHNL